MSIYFKKPPLLPLILSIAGIIVLVGLGIWQLERLEWKTALLSKINDSYNSASPLLLSSDGLNSENIQNLELESVSVKGIYNDDKSILLQPRTYNREIGYHLVTPLEISNDRYILVNRGWVSSDKQSYSAPDGPIIVSGVIRQPDKANIFTPENNPKRGDWFSINKADYERFYDIDIISPLALYAYKENPEHAYPIKDALKLQPANNHLGYALFWFMMAASLEIIFILRFCIGRRS